MITFYMHMIVIATNRSHWGLDSMTSYSILKSYHLTVAYWLFIVLCDVQDP